MHILVVEDEALIRLAAVDFFEEAGFEVIEAAAADEALQILHRSDTVFVLFTDINTPGALSGLELAHIVYDRWPHIRIMVASGHVDAKAPDLPAGATFFRKPYNHEHVVQHVRAHVSLM